jgi:hypothetical protein
MLDLGARTPGRQQARTGIGIAGLLGFVLATSVDARQPPHEELMPVFHCEPGYPVEVSPAQHGFSPHGSYWSMQPPANAAEASCTWTADTQQIPAILEHYLARPDGYYYNPTGWTWISSGAALDAAMNWSLTCEWLPAGCTPETCADQRQMIELPARPIIVPRDAAVAISYVDPVLEDRTCTGREPMLRLEIRQPLDPGFWQDGGVLRVGYADGTYFVTSPESDDYQGSVMTLVPPPQSDETWFGVEVVRGDGVVLDATRFDLGPTFWDSIVVIHDPPPYSGHDEPRRQGCHRAG